MLLIKRNKGIFTTAAAAWLLITVLAVWFVFHLQAKERRAIAGEQSAIAEAERAMKAEAIAVEEKEAARLSSAKANLALADAALREQDGTLMTAALNAVDEDLRDADWRYLFAEADSSIATVDTGNREIIGVAADPKRPGVFAFADTKHKVTVMHARSGEQLLQFDANALSSRYLELAFSPVGEHLAIGTRHPGGGIAIHSGLDGKKLWEWDAPRTEQLEFSPDGNILLQTTPKPGEKIASTGVQARDAATGKLLWMREDLGLGPRSTFTPDSKQVIVCPDYGAIAVLSASEGVTLHSFSKPDTETGAIHPDGKSMIIALRNGAIQAIDLKDGKILYEIPRQADRIWHLAFRADGRRFFSVVTLKDGRQAIQVWDAATGGLLRSLLGGDGNVTSIAIHPFSDELIVAGGRSKLYDCSGHEAWTLTEGSPKRAGAFCGSDEIFLGEHGVAFALRKLEKGKMTTLWKADSEPFPKEASISVAGKLALALSNRKQPAGILIRDLGTRVETVSAFTLSQIPPAKPGACNMLTAQSGLFCVWGRLKAAMSR